MTENRRPALPLNHGTTGKSDMLHRALQRFPGLRSDHFNSTESFHHA
jgi:hypothetical protein